MRVTIGGRCRAVIDAQDHYRCVLVNPVQQAVRSATPPLNILAPKGACPPAGLRDRSPGSHREGFAVAAVEGDARLVGRTV